MHSLCLFDNDMIILYMLDENAINENLNLFHIQLFISHKNKLLPSK